MSDVIQFVGQAPSYMLRIGAVCVLVSCFVLIPVAVALDDQRTVNEIESLPVAGVAVAIFLIGVLLIVKGERENL